MPQKINNICIYKAQITVPTKTANKLLVWENNKLQDNQKDFGKKVVALFEKQFELRLQFKDARHQGGPTLAVRTKCGCDEKITIMFKVPVKSVKKNRHVKLQIHKDKPCDSCDEYLAKIIDPEKVEMTGTKSKKNTRRSAVFQVPARRPYHGTPVRSSARKSKFSMDEVMKEIRNIDKKLEKHLKEDEKRKKEEEKFKKKVKEQFADLFDKFYDLKAEIDARETVDAELSYDRNSAASGEYHDPGTEEDEDEDEDEFEDSLSNNNFFEETLPEFI